MRRENYGSFAKVHWSRSSRTDKGVHSLATVISLKIHRAPDSWQADPEGIDCALAINRCTSCAAHCYGKVDHSPLSDVCAPCSTLSRPIGRCRSLLK